MIAALALAWLALGLVVLAGRVPARVPAAVVPVLRGVAGAAWLGGVALLWPGCGGVLAVTAMVLAAMAFGSVAALLVLRPRLYATSVVIAAVIAALGAALA